MKGDVRRTCGPETARWLLCAALLSSTAQAQDTAVVKLVSAALQYVSAASASAPAAQPLPNHNDTCTCANSSRNSSAAPTIVRASVQSSAGQPPNATSAEDSRNLRPCGKFGQQQHFQGSWQDSPDPDYHGEYDMTLDCPKWINDYDCQHPPANAHIDPNLIRSEYRKVFVPNECALRPFDAAAFDARFAGGRRLILLGDSLMRLHFYSLACLARSHITSGAASSWAKSNITWQGTYTQRWTPGDGTNVTKQFVGGFTMASGGQVFLRDFGTLNQTLFDDVLSDFQPLSEDDVLVLNWGAWYHRYDWGGREVAWMAWQRDIKQLFQDRLSQLPAQVIWKQHAPPHFCGPTGTETGIESELPGGPWRYTCEPASVGEFWYDDYITSLLKGPCKKDCANISVLPIFDMTRPRHLSQHGSLGRGSAQGQADCRHWCNNMVDQWSILLYNVIC